MNGVVKRKFSGLGPVPVFVCSALVTLGVCVANVVGSDAVAYSVESWPVNWLPEIANSADLTSAVVAQGTVADARGRTLADADVVLMAWPAEDELELARPGDPVRVTPVAKARTDGSGRYVLRIADDFNLGPFASGRTGEINFEIVAHTEAGSRPFSFSRLWRGGSNTVLLDRDIHGEHLSGPSAIDLGVDQIGSLENGDTSTTVQEKIQFDSLIGYYDPSWDLVGQQYVATTGVTAGFEYTSGSSSQLGVGFSTSGAFGSFSTGGTSSKSSTATITFPSVGANTFAYYDTQFRWGLYLVTSVDSYGNSVSWYDARPAIFVGGTRVRHPSSAPSATFCSSFAAGSSFSKANSTAATWSDGAATAPIIGINLSTRTGYSTAAQLTYTFASSRQLCGVSDYPPGSPRQIVAKP